MMIVLPGILTHFVLCRYLGPYFEKLAVCDLCTKVQGDWKPFLYDVLT